jgi:hypothetical protein
MMGEFYQSLAPRPDILRWFLTRYWSVTEADGVSISVLRRNCRGKVASTSTGRSVFSLSTPFEMGGHF